MCSLCQLPVATNLKFGQIVTFWGLLYRLRFTDEGQVRCAKADPCIRLRAKFLLETTKNFAFFGLRHFVVSQVGSSLKELNTGAQPQTFPYPTVSKPFLYSNSFLVKSNVEAPSFKIVTDTQTDKQREKNSTFLAPRRRMKLELHQTWHGDRGHRASSCTSKTFGGPMHSFAARGW